MKDGAVQVICGPGRGKTNAAIGQAISAISDHKSVIMIQFLKGSLNTDRMDILKRLEPEMKVFRFEKAGACFESLTEEEKSEEMMNIRNGLNFAKKVMMTGECELLILDEILGIVDCGIITEKQLIEQLESREGEMSLILTGKVLPAGLESYADHITYLQEVK